MAEANPTAPAAATAPSTSRSMALPAWLTKASTVDVLFIVAVSLVALVLRTIDLDEFPIGLHGDEAWTGLDAQTILDGKPGEIWPYTRGALGQPGGPMFWAAPFEWALGPSVLAVRLPMAIIGVLTVIVGFYAMHVLFNRPAAYAWAVLAACSSWLIFFNRTGFTVPFMPFTEVAALLAVGIALKKRWWPWYVGAGAFVGLGIYGYFSYPLFALGLGIYVLVHFAIERPAPFWPHTRNIALMGLAALLVIQPMVPFMTGAEDIGYRRDRDVFAVKKTQRYLDATSTTEKIDIYLDNGLDLARTLIWKGWVDYSDGSGSDPALDFIVVTLAAVGLALSLWLAFRERKAAYLLPWIMIPIIAIGPLWNWGGYHRRSLGLLVFILMAAAVALGWMYDRVQRHDRKEFTAIAAGVFVLVLAWYSYTNIDKYWSQRDTGAIGFTFAPELAIAARWASDQPDDVPIYFFAQRWSVNYESSKYLLDGHTALMDGSKEFVKEGQTPGLPTVDRSQDAVIILLQGYIAMYDVTISQQYPDATRYEGRIRGTTPSFVAYVVPKK